MVDELLDENPDADVKNINGDKGYLSEKNAEGLKKREIRNSIIPRKGSSRKVSKSNKNRRKCIEGLFGILVLCLGMQEPYVRGRNNVLKDTYLKYIALFFQVVVAVETGVEDKYLKPTYFFG